MNKKDRIFILGTGAALSFGTLGLVRVFGVRALLFPISAGVCLIGAIQIWAARKAARSSERLRGELRQVDLGIRKHLEKQINDHYRQVEALFSIFSILKIERPLPSMSRWAAPPEIMSLTISIIKERRPEFVVEVGSGVSTLITAYCLKGLGQGRLVALEHEKEFADRTAHQLREHGLDDVASVIHAPLTNLSINGEDWLWYETRDLENATPIDLLVVDGPPGNTQPMARYPALPVLRERLSQDAVILLHDSFRRDEKAIVAKWGQEFQFLRHSSVDCSGGAEIFTRRQSDEPVGVGPGGS